MLSYKIDLSSVTHLYIASLVCHTLRARAPATSLGSLEGFGRGRVRSSAGLSANTDRSHLNKSQYRQGRQHVGLCREMLLQKKACFDFCIGWEDGFQIKSLRKTTYYSCFNVSKIDVPDIKIWISVRNHNIKFFSCFHVLKINFQQQNDCLSFRTFFHPCLALKATSQ